MKSKLASFLALLVAVLIMAPANVLAVVPTAYTDAIDAVVADSNTLTTYAYAALVGVALIVTLGVIALKMVKRGRSAV